MALVDVVSLDSLTPGEERRRRLLGRRELLITYLMENVREQDWHGCADACMDLREVDAELRGLKYER